MDGRDPNNEVGSSYESAVVADENGFPVIVRSYEPVPDLDDRLRRIYELLSLPPFPC